MRLTTTLAACQCHLTLTREDGEVATAILHLEASGHLGVAKPSWAYSREVAEQTVPILRTVLATLEGRIADATCWPTREEEGGSDDVPIVEPPPEAEASEGA